METHKTGRFITAVIALVIASVALAEPDTTTTDKTKVYSIMVLPNDPPHDPPTEPPTDPPTEETAGCGNSLQEKPRCSKSLDGNHTCADCTTAPMLSFGTYYYAGIVNCAAWNASTPYCTNGKCSATASDECSTDPPKFICTSSGYFPDPDNCRKFYFCVKDTAAEYTCSNNFVYSHQRKACIRQANSSDCAVINCTHTRLMEYVIYPKDPNVYGLCIRDHPTLMFKCPEEEQFDTKTSQCIFVCKKAGLFAVPGDKQKYRECVDVGKELFELYERECPLGSMFDPTKGKCVLTRRLFF